MGCIFAEMENQLSLFPGSSKRDSFRQPHGIQSHMMPEEVGLVQPIQVSFPEERLGKEIQVVDAESMVEVKDLSKV